MYAGLKTTADQYGVVPVSIPGATRDLMPLVTNAFCPLNAHDVRRP